MLKTQQQQQKQRFDGCSVGSGVGNGVVMSGSYINGDSGSGSGGNNEREVYRQVQQWRQQW